MKQPELIKLKPADVEALLERVKDALQEGDYEIIKGLVEAFIYLSQSVNEKATSVRRLCGSSSAPKRKPEKSFSILPQPRKRLMPQWKMMTQLHVHKAQLHPHNPNRKSSRGTAETALLIIPKPSISRFLLRT